MVRSKSRWVLVKFYAKSLSKSSESSLNNISSKEVIDSIEVTYRKLYGAIGLGNFVKASSIIYFNSDFNLAILKVEYYSYENTLCSILLTTSIKDVVVTPQILSVSATFRGLKKNLNSATNRLVSIDTLTVV